MLRHDYKNTDQKKDLGDLTERTGDGVQVRNVEQSEERRGGITLGQALKTLW